MALKAGRILLESPLCMEKFFSGKEAGEGENVERETIS